MIQYARSSNYYNNVYLLYQISLLMAGNPLTGTLANSEDTGSALFAKAKLIFRGKIQYFLESIICDPSAYIMGHPDLTESQPYGKFHWSKKD